MPGIVAAATTDRLPNGYRAAAVIQFGVLGPVEARRDGMDVRLGGRNQRAVLALLLLQARRVVSIERLADDLYGGETPVSAVTQVHRQVSELRRALGEDGAAIETRAPGYLARVAPEALDLGRFEALAEQGLAALRASDPAAGAEALREALSLWRGPPLADIADEPFAQRPVARLEEMRLAALEHRIEADLQLGRDSDLVAELRELCDEHPLRERLREMLMLALYRAGRQVEALDVYRDARRELNESFGLEPGPGLRELERAILSHDAALAAPTPLLKQSREGLLLVVARDPARLESMLDLAGQLARRPLRSVVAALLVTHEDGLAEGSAHLERIRRQHPARMAAFIAAQPERDVQRLARSHEPDLLLLDAPPGFDAPGAPSPELAEMLASSPCDVAIVARPTGSSHGGPVVVPLGGGEHEWAAAEIGAWLAAASDVPLRLAGARADADGGGGGRDASRLLADASLAIQQTVGIAAEPFLVGGLAEAATDAGVVVIGLSPRWLREGLGDARRSLVVGAGAPVLLVHRGPRPSGIAPGASATRFTWSLGGG